MTLACRVQSAKSFLNLSCKQAMAVAPEIGMDQQRISYPPMFKGVRGLDLDQQCFCFWCSAGGLGLARAILPGCPGDGVELCRDGLRPPEHECRGPSSQA